MTEFYGEAVMPRSSRRSVTEKLNSGYTSSRRTYNKAQTTSRVNRIKTVSKNNSKAMLKRVNKNIVLFILVSIGLLLLISYRAAVINSCFTEKEKLKKSLSKLEKENAQLQVNIEQQMNVSKIEQEASERLGMKKLDTNQKVYVSLDKKDYIESANSVVASSDESWFNKFINVLKGE